MKQLLAREARRLLGTYLNTLLCYPDRHFHNEPVVDPVNGNIIVDPAHLASDRIYSRENRLLNIIHGEISQGRRCFVCGARSFSPVRPRNKRM
ncbi:MAG: hypothetical protein WBG50_14000 [Desulfomonilaceae bacterium]